jgi:hypothetical protein
MKLKEKLAQEAAAQSGIESRTGRINYRNGFEAGFEEARELCEETKRKCFEEFNYHQQAGASKIKLTMDLSQVGEEEVKMSEQTIKCPICGEPYVFYMYMAGDQSACPDCRRKARTKK